ncbi:hypothetical protein FRC08_002914 [Ceratobasidium sp. 394]|nr:hypothetical protein FRC08_002914 [Ceratobasidium sp. 394]
MQQSRLRDLGQSHAAWYSSAESKKLYRDECTPDTRVEALERFRVWRDGEKTEKIYWLNGMAGTGKTTLSYTLCKQLEHEQRLAANFFCSRQLPDCKKAHRILPTIACQLADFSYPFRYALSSILRQDPNVHTRRISEQCTKLLFTPLHEVRASLPHNLVVVIEALDECDNSDEVDELLEMLFEYAPRFPVKFFLTSRPEPVIRVRMLGRTGPREEFELHLHELDRAIVGEDIKKYLEVGLKRANISAGDLQVLTERSGVLFIYAATVVRFIGDQSFTKSADRLELVLREATSSSGSERGIDALYTLILRQAFSRLVNTERQNMRLVLHTAICAREPLAVRTMANLLQMRVESVHSALSALRSVLNVEQSSEEITTLHKSFPDYILDSTRSRGFSCDAKKRHAELAQQCFAITNAPNPLFNTWHVCDMGYHSRHARAVPALIEKPGMDISGEIFYAFRYWGAHLCLAGDSQHLLGESYTFLSERLLLWVEIMKLKQCLQPSGVAMLSEVQIWTRNSKYDARDGTQELLKDAIRGIKTGRIGFR